MSDPWNDDELRALRRQEADDERLNDELEELVWAEHDAEMNELTAGWVDARGNPLPGFEPVDVPDLRSSREAVRSRPAWWEERRRIELQALRR
jgi:hypothetical protein